MPKISADPAVYGKYAEVTAIADYWETLALHGRAVSHAQMSDLIRDNDWNVRDFFLMAGEGRSDAEDIEEPLDVATAVVATLDERSDMLGQLYPFGWEEERRLCVQIDDPKESGYVALLAITACHAYRIESPVAPHEVFEDTVVQVIAHDRLKAVNLGKHRRSEGTFEAALRVAGAEIDLNVAPEAAIRMAYAHDEGVDTICHLSWGDTRPGIWSMIGQVTCARSNDWRAKVRQAHPEPWRLLLSVGYPKPWVFLAVPHHVAPDHLRKLVQDSEALVLDRIRLARFKDGVSTDERQLIESLVTSEIDYP